MIASRRALRAATLSGSCLRAAVSPYASSSFHRSAASYATEAAAPAQDSTTDDTASSTSTPNATKPPAAKPPASKFRSSTSKSTSFASKTPDNSTASTQPSTSTTKPAARGGGPQPVVAVRPVQPVSSAPRWGSKRTHDSSSAPAGSENHASLSQDVDWTTSFRGVSQQAVTKEQFLALTMPLKLDDIEVKPDGIIYLPEIKYRRRLNDAFGPMGWGLVPRGDPVVGNTIVTREYALIVDGRFVSQAQGENQYFSAEQLPSSVEGCKSNALMRCCKDLGIASDLWDPAFIRYFRANKMEAVWVEHVTTKKKRQIWFKKGQVDVQYPFKKTSA